MLDHFFFPEPLYLAKEALARALLIISLRIHSLDSEGKNILQTTYEASQICWPPRYPSTTQSCWAKTDYPKTTDYPKICSFVFLPQARGFLPSAPIPWSPASVPTAAAAPGPSPDLPSAGSGGPPPVLGFLRRGRRFPPLDPDPAAPSSPGESRPPPCLSPAGRLPDALFNVGQDPASRSPPSPAQPLPTPLGRPTVASSWPPRRRRSPPSILPDHKV